MLTVEGVKKSFGKKEVVKGVSFEVKSGEAFGLLGPNGAGKSTTISMICGLLQYDEGEIKIDSLSVKNNASAVRKKIGIVPQEIALYPTMTAKDNLIFWGKMYGLNKSQISKRLGEVLEIIGLTERAKDRVETFSGGMKRRLNIGAALMHEPEVLIMDEPTVGIDPQSRKHILDTVKMLNQKGMTVIYTSHYMEEVEFLCDRIAIIDHGNVIAVGSKQELFTQLESGKTITVQLDNLTDSVLESFNQLEGIKHVKVQNENELVIQVQESEQILSDIVKLTTEQGLRITSVNVQEPNLESLFLQLTGRTLRD